ncbi:MAG: peptide-methionine (S)-S-oxide reductase MsrA [Candidatus Baltobacteraceae bacterium]
MKIDTKRGIAAVITGLLTLALIVFPAAPARSAAAPKATERVVLAGGCFWGMQGVFESVKGVTRVVAGYSGGTKSTANYETVSTGTTGHAESVQIDFDPSKISFTQLLNVYFLVAQDPTQLNRQGPDSGTQYRSVIFYTSDGQKHAAQAYIKTLEARKIFRDPIVTQVVPFHAFYQAEAYHQDFMARNPNNPYIVINDKPKVEQLQAKFPQLAKS